MKLTGTNGQTNNTTLSINNQANNLQTRDSNTKNQPLTRLARQTKQGTNKSAHARPQSGCQTTNTPREWVRIEDFAVVMAQEKRPIPFRTWKLSPGTVMVLHARACGRVTHCRNKTLQWRLATMTAASLQPYSTHEHLR